MGVKKLSTAEKIQKQKNQLALLEAKQKYEQAKAAITKK